jgi:uracil-DNA glycosylase family protein
MGAARKPKPGIVLPAKPSLASLRKAAAGCKACDLWKMGTQTVFGEGARGASLMLIGEQPGNDEDLAGHPFVGPAGKLLDRALEAAGIDRAEAYVTNAVKHFKWEPRGKRRIHKKPNTTEMTACRPWLEAEIAVVRPKLLASVRLPRSRCSGTASASRRNEGASSIPTTACPRWPPCIRRRCCVRRTTRREGGRRSCWCAT